MCIRSVKFNRVVKMKFKNIIKASIVASGAFFSQDLYASQENQSIKYDINDPSSVMDTFRTQRSVNGFLAVFPGELIEKILLSATESREGLHSIYAVNRGFQALMLSGIVPCKVILGDIYKKTFVYKVLPQDVEKFRNVNTLVIGSLQNLFKLPGVIKAKHLALDIAPKGIIDTLQYHDGFESFLASQGGQRIQNLNAIKAKKISLDSVSLESLEVHDYVEILILINVNFPKQDLSFPNKSIKSKPFFGTNLSEVTDYKDITAGYLDLSEINNVSSLTLDSMELVSNESIKLIPDCVKTLALNRLYRVTDVNLLKRFKKLIFKNMTHITDTTELGQDGQEFIEANDPVMPMPHMPMPHMPVLHMPMPHMPVQQHMPMLQF